MDKKTSTVNNMIANMEEVDRLLAIHEKLTGKARGRRHQVDVLNKSAIVLITACWEALAEDIATQAFDFLLAKVNDHNKIPIKIRTLASRKLKDAEDHTKVWELAGDGWKQVLINYRDHTLDRFVGSLNTPRAANIDNMFRDLLDFTDISSSWKWGSLTSQKAINKLDRFITLRGAIAHRVSTSESVSKNRVRDFRKFAFRLAVKTSNAVNSHIYKIVGETPFDEWKFGGVS
jgi:hypothetical protein